MVGSILVVDDDRDNAEALSEALADEGYAVAAAAGGLAGLERLARGPKPDVILLDITMADIDGYEFRRRQSSDPEIAGIPTYLVTGRVLDAKRIRQTTGWFLKPVILEDLLGVVGRHCQSTAAAPDHLVHFYDDDAALVARVSGFIAEGLARGEAAAAICTAEHRDALRSALEGRGIDTRPSETHDRLLFLDAHEVLAQVFTGGVPDKRRFDALAGPTIQRLARAAPTGGVRAYGELVSLLWQSGDVASTFVLESFWNEAAFPRFTLLCGYLKTGAPADPCSNQALTRQHAAAT